MKWIHVPALLALIVLTVKPGFLSSLAIGQPVSLTASSTNAANSPSMSISGSHRWIVWSEYVQTGGESIRLRAQRFAGKTSQEGPFTVETGRLMSPVVLTQADGAAWFFWIEVTGSGGQLRARQRRAGSWVQSSPLTVATARAAYPAATLDQSGDPWVAFEAHDDEISSVKVAHWNGSAFSTASTISQTGVPAYAPVLETDTQGAIWVVWQGLRSAQLRDLRPTPCQRLAGTPPPGLSPLPVSMGTVISAACMCSPTIHAGANRNRLDRLGRQRAGRARPGKPPASFELGARSPDPASPGES